MKKISLVLCAAALLSACGQRGGSSETGEKPVADGDQVRAEMQAAQEAATAELDKAQRQRDDVQDEKGAERRLSEYKRRLLPLIAGSYGGDCRGKSGRLSGAAITIGDDGQVQAPGIKARSLGDPDGSLAVTTDTTRAPGARPGFVASNRKQDWSVTTTGISELTTNLVDGDATISCIGSGPAPSGRSGGVYAALAQYFIPAAGLMECEEGKGSASRQEIRLSDTELSIGSNSYLLSGQGASEMAIADPEDMSLTYQRGSANDQQVSMKLDSRGKLATVMVLSQQKRTSMTCTPVRG